MSVAVASTAVEAVQEKPVDREKICPFLLRIFCANSRHNPLLEYQRGNVPSNELQVYTWMDCNLRELTALIKEVNPDARRRGTQFEYQIVSPDRYSTRFVAREIGICINGTRGVEDNKTLSQSRFEIGDFIDVAISVPGPGGATGLGARGPGGRERDGRDTGRFADRFSDRFADRIERFGAGGGRGRF